MVDEAYTKAQEVLNDNRERLDKIAQVLIERETVDKDQLLALLETGELPPEPEEKEAADSEEPVSVEADQSEEIKADNGKEEPDKGQSSDSEPSST